MSVMMPKRMKTCAPSDGDEVGRLGSALMFLGPGRHAGPDGALGFSLSLSRTAHTTKGAGIPRTNPRKWTREGDNPGLADKAHRRRTSQIFCLCLGGL